MPDGELKRVIARRGRALVVVLAVGVAGVAWAGCGSDSSTDESSSQLERTSTEGIEEATEAVEKGVNESEGRSAQGTSNEDQEASSKKPKKKSRRALKRARKKSKRARRRQGRSPEGRRRSRKVRALDRGRGRRPVAGPGRSAAGFSGPSSCAPGGADALPVVEAEAAPRQGEDRAREASRRGAPGAEEAARLALVGVAPPEGQVDVRSRSRAAGELRDAGDEDRAERSLLRGGRS